MNKEVKVGNVNNSPSVLTSSTAWSWDERQVYDSPHTRTHTTVQ